jgi:hypothetical protein
MSRTVSPSVGRRYDLAQVCGVWEVARSSVYARRTRPDISTTRAAQAGTQDQMERRRAHGADPGCDHDLALARRGVSEGLGAARHQGHPGMSSGGCCG